MLTSEGPGQWKTQTKTQMIDYIAYLQFNLLNI